MLHHQDQAQNPAYGGQKGGASPSPSSSLRNRKRDKDSNFNFLLGKDDAGGAAIGSGGRGGGGGGGGGGDENRNQVRPRNLSPLGRDTPSSGLHHGPGPGPLSPLSRLPCWSPLEPLPEIEGGDDSSGRVPPDGAEERKMVEEETRGMRMTLAMMAMMNRNNEKERAMGRKMGMEELEYEEALEDRDEWGDSDSEFEFSGRSGGSMSSLNMESAGEGVLMGGWDRIGVGEPRSHQQGGGGDDNRAAKEPSARQRSAGQKAPGGGGPGNGVTEGRPRDDDDDDERDEDQSSDSDGEMPDLMDPVWTLRDREHFKAQEMEKHQVQLTMYRRLALIRWVRTLQSRVEEQQNRLQSSFDVILTQRKELLRMGATASVSIAPPAAAVGQS